MKMSLRQMILMSKYPSASAQDCCTLSSSKLFVYSGARQSYVLMPQVFKQLELAVGTLRKDGSAKRLHNLLNRHRLASELILCRATRHPSTTPFFRSIIVPWTHQTSPKAPMPTGCRSVYLDNPSASPLERLCHTFCFRAECGVPARDLERRAENLGTYEFRHVAGVASRSTRG